MPARAIGSGTISFGLVSIQVAIYTATSPKTISFHMLHKTCGSRVKQQLKCPVENVVLEEHEIIRGFEYSKDQYVRFTPEELKALEIERTGAIELVEFVPAESVDLLYIEKTYYLGPEKGAEKAYQLLSKALERSKRLAIGRQSSRGKDNLVIIRPWKGKLVLHEAFYETEVRSFDDVPTGGEFEFSDLVRELAAEVIEKHSKEAFDPTLFKDTWRERVEAAVQQKIAGEEVVIQAEQPKAQVIDLLEALKRTVARDKEAREAAQAQLSEPMMASGSTSVPPSAPTMPGPKKTSARAGAERRTPKKSSGG